MRLLIVRPLKNMAPGTGLSNGPQVRTCVDREVGIVLSQTCIALSCSVATCRSAAMFGLCCPRGGCTCSIMRTDCHCRLALILFINYDIIINRNAALAIQQFEVEDFAARSTRPASAAALRIQQNLSRFVQTSQQIAHRVATMTITTQ